MSGLAMKYFVLKPRGDDAYAEASRQAMLTYALHIHETDPELCQELRDWVEKEAASIT